MLEAVKMRYRSFFAAMMSLALLSGLVSMAGPLLLNAGPVSITAAFLLLAVLAASLAAGNSAHRAARKVFKGYNIDNFKSLLNKYFHLDYDEINRGPINLLERIARPSTAYICI